MERDALGRQRQGLDHIWCAFPSRSAPCLTCALLPWLQVALHRPSLREQPPTLPKAWSPGICTLSSLRPVFPSLCPAGGMAGACGSHALLSPGGPMCLGTSYPRSCGVASSVVPISLSPGALSTLPAVPQECGLRTLTLVVWGQF